MAHITVVGCRELAMAAEVECLVAEVVAIPKQGVLQTDPDQMDQTDRLTLAALVVDHLGGRVVLLHLIRTLAVAVAALAV
jgi:hypothetical protein